MGARLTRFIQSIREILDTFDVAVLDQWGVLHNGSVPYPHAAEAITLLHEHGKTIIILSNSGKRAGINRKRIADMGLPAEYFSAVVTSGEALRDDILSSRLKINGKTPRMILPICGKPGDAEAWRGDSTEIEFAHSCEGQVDCIMLMGLPDGSKADIHDDTFDKAVAMNIPLICSNPDKTSPRAGGLVISPGALAERYATMGGQVVWYGKPYQPVFQAAMRCQPAITPSRFLMVGDSLEHDIAGAQQAGFSTAWVRGGIHADAFDGSQGENQLASLTNDLAKQKNTQPPDFSLYHFA